MKPRAFIGSSVEGLNVAYAIQQNLLYDAEITVWSQGVFDLSATAVESLLTVLSSSDFGIFVFTPDDIASLRNEKVSVVRDNVLFELGLFIGKLGRERSFFLIPDNATDLHIPTDLLGITPAKYEGARTDSNMQAATGPACHQLRAQFKKVGLQANRLASPSSPEEAAQPEQEKDRNWFEHFVAGKYGQAKQLLEVKRQTETGDDLLRSEGWVLYCDLKSGEKGALEDIYKFARNHPTSLLVQSFIGLVLSTEWYADKAIELLQEADNSLKDHPDMRLRIADCHLSNGDTALALEALNGAGLSNLPAIAIKKSVILENSGQPEEALRVVHAAYLNQPRDESLRFRYALVAAERSRNEIAIFFLDGLTKDFPEKSSYWGYLGNACLSLGLNDQALVAYRRGIAAPESTDSRQWLFANIGNLMTNRDLPSEACVYLEQVIKIEPSEYAYERLAGAMKKKDAELKEFTTKCAEGLKQVRSFKVEVASAENDATPS